MRTTFKRAFAIVLCELLALLPASGAAQGPQTTPERASAAAPQPALRDVLQQGYLELFQTVPDMHFSAAEIAAQRAALEQGKKTCVTRFKDHAKAYQKQLEATQKELKQTTAFRISTCCAAKPKSWPTMPFRPLTAI